MKILSKYLRKYIEPNVVSIEIRNGIDKTTVESGPTLLKKTKHRYHQVIKTHQCVSATKDVWQRNYLALIAGFAELAQGLPASKDYHHSYKGGLLDHSLETMANAVRISTGYILPPGAQAEDISKHSERWRMGILICALLHDAGKIHSDWEVMIKQGDGWYRHLPLYDDWPIGAQYKFRYKPSTKGHSKALHERSALLVFKQLVKRSVFNWLQEDPELLQQMYDSLTYFDSPNNTIREIIVKADMASVKTALGDQPLRTQNDEVPIADKIMSLLRNMIREGDMVINAPGASMWSTCDHSFVVSKRVMEEIKLRLTQAGHKSVPTNVEKLYQILANAGYVEKHPIYENEIIWLCEIRDHLQNWNGKLTFLTFKNNVLISDYDLPCFDGEIEVYERNKKDATNIVFTSTGMIDGRNLVEHSRSEVNAPDSAGMQKDTSKKVELTQATLDVDTPTKQDKKKIHHKPVENTSNNEYKESSVLKDDTLMSETRLSLRMVSNEELACLPKISNLEKQTLLMKNPFVNFIIAGVKDTSIKCNRQNAPVHVTKDFILFVSPVAFSMFFKSKGNRMKERVYATHYSTPLTGLQKEFESLGVNKVGKNGRNIIKVKIEGKEKSSFLYAFAVPRAYFPTMDSFSPNPVLRLPDDL